MSPQTVQCPFCGTTFKVDADWIVKNERVFCGTCCKAFDAKLEEEKPKEWYGEFYD